MKFKEFDAVRLTNDFPELGLKAGDQISKELQLDKKIKTNCSKIEIQN